MGRVQFSVVVNRPADEVFAYLTDFDRQPEWQDGVLSSRHEPPGPVAVGTRVTKVRRKGGRDFVFTDEITDYDPAQRVYAERVIDTMIRGSGSRWSVAAESSGSRITVEAELRASGLAKLLQPYVVSSGKQDLERALARMKAVLEGEPATVVANGGAS